MGSSCPDHTRRENANGPLLFPTAAAGDAPLFCNYRPCTTSGAHTNRVRGMCLSNQSDTPMVATAHLPGLRIDVLHHRSSDGEAEQISINLKAVPSFDAFSRHLENVNLFALWAELAQMIWLPWLEATRTGMLSWQAPQRPRAIASEPGSASPKPHGL